MLFGLTSCHDDNPVTSNPLVTEVSGTWWTIIDQEGTFAGYLPYTHVGTGICLNEDGTGYGTTFYFNDENSDPIAMRGGQSFAPFTYTTTADGLITLQFENGYQPDVDYFTGMTLRYRDGSISIASTQYSTQLEKANDFVAQLISQWDNAMNDGIAMEEHNPNDADFNHDTWREQEAIYIYDREGPETVRDAKGRSYSGFSVVALPSYKGSAGVNSNLPMKFCDKITPDNGWDLVMNTCGSTAEPNRNFFALYNKWLGTLRFFVYVPHSFSAGNDHLWEVTMSGDFALKQGHHYGVPLDVKIADPAALGLDANGTSQHVSPWVESRSSDGLITLNAGWWAFDVDLSQYQPDFTYGDDQIRLQARSWNKQNASFVSDLLAQIDGTFDAEMNEVQSAKSSAMKATSEGLQAICNLGGAIAHAASGEYGYSFEAFGGFLGNAFGCGMEAGIDDSYTKVEGTLDLHMTGSIDTRGIFQGSSPVIGVSSPTLPLANFDAEHTQMGRGVWNLKTSPVVWLTNAETDLDGLYDFWHKYNSEIGTAKNQQRYFPRLGAFYFFDPSSIEVALNPGLFPESEIEWTNVETYCLYRGQNGITGTDNYRKALGLSTRYPKAWGNVLSPISNSKGEALVELNDADIYMDYFHYGNRPDGYDYPAIISVEKRNVYDSYFGKYWVIYDVAMGCGKEGGVSFEPFPMAEDKLYNEEPNRRIPALEVMVTLRVKLRSSANPLVLVRQYLPEVKPLDLA